MLNSGMMNAERCWGQRAKCRGARAEGSGALSIKRGTSDGRRERQGALLKIQHSSFNIQHSALPRALLALVLLLMCGAAPVLAEGPGTGGSRIFISDKTVGNYVLLVWAGPSPPQVGRYTVYVRVSDSSGQQLRDGLQISVRATEEANGEVTDSEANHTNAGNSLDYAAHFQLPRKGNYQFAVTVQGAAGDAQVSFRDRVVATISFGLISAIAGPFIVLIAAVFWYMWSRQSKDKPAAGA